MNLKENEVEYNLTSSEQHWFSNFLVDFLKSFLTSFFCFVFKPIFCNSLLGSSLCNRNGKSRLGMLKRTMSNKIWTNFQKTAPSSSPIQISPDWFGSLCVDPPIWLGGPYFLFSDPPSQWEVPREVPLVRCGILREAPGEKGRKEDRSYSISDEITCVGWNGWSHRRKGRRP